MKKIITTIAVVSTFALSGIASAQSIVPTNSNSGTTSVTTDTSGMGTIDTTSANTNTNTGAGTSSVGVPNTGAGGDAAANLAILATTGAIAIVAAAYALRARKTL